MIGEANSGIHPEEIKCDSKCRREKILTYEGRKFHDFIECKFSLVRLEKYLKKAHLNELKVEIQRCTSDIENKSKILKATKKLITIENTITNREVKMIKIRKKGSEYSVLNKTRQLNETNTNTESNYKDSDQNISLKTSLTCSICYRVFSSKEQQLDTSEHICALLAKTGYSIKPLILKINKNNKRELLLGKEKEKEKKKK